jgi:hypothetical protein
MRQGNTSTIEAIFLKWMWSRALNIRLSDWCCSVSMVWVQIRSREKTNICQLKDLILSLFGLIFRHIYIYIYIIYVYCQKIYVYELLKQMENRAFTVNICSHYWLLIQSKLGLHLQTAIFGNVLKGLVPFPCQHTYM